MSFNPTLIIGIDPGLSGAIAVFDTFSQKLIRCEDLPTTRHSISETRRDIDLATLTNTIDLYAKETKFAVVEDVHAMTYGVTRGNQSEVRGQGAAASFAFGKAAGVVHGILAANRIPIYFVKPAVWKALMGLSKDKNESRERAMTLFPEKRVFFLRKKDDGRAEAALLAKFGAERFK